jgi:FkbM family methyltransferase
MTELFRIDLAPYEMEGEFWTFDNQMEIVVVRDVLSGFAYRPPEFPLEDVKTIVDIGAHVGSASVYFSHHFPEATVYAFEPNPMCCHLLRQNVAGRNVQVFEQGLADRTRTAILDNSYCPSNASVWQRKTTEKRPVREGVAVIMREAANAMKHLAIDRVDILKIDTEGCEVQILRSLVKDTALMPIIKVIYVEYHSELDRRATDDLLQYTHVLQNATAEVVHNGVLCYVLSSLLPVESRLRAIL